MIAVTGATGHLGRLVIQQLLEKKVPANQIVAWVRTPSKAEDLRALGVTVRTADYHQPETFASALEGVDKLLLVSSNDFNDRAGQHRRVLDAAKKAGVKHIVYTSILRGTESPLILANDHRTTEQYLETLGVPFTVLRNGWYIENHLDVSTVLQHGVVGASGQGRISGATRADYAAAAVAVLTGQGHEGKRYELAGDTSFSKAELAAEFAKQSGKPVPNVDLPADAFKGVLTGAGLPEPVADIFVDADVQVSKGALEDGSKTLSKLIGRPTTPLATAIASVLAAPRATAP